MKKPDFNDHKVYEAFLTEQYLRADRISRSDIPNRKPILISTEGFRAPFAIDSRILELAVAINKDDRFGGSLFEVTEEGGWTVTFSLASKYDCSAWIICNISFEGDEPTIETYDMRGCGSDYPVPYESLDQAFGLMTNSFLSPEEVEEHEKNMAAALRV